MPLRRGPKSWNGAAGSKHSGTVGITVP
jgi:hypothetical protein